MNIKEVLTTKVKEAVVTIFNVELPSVEFQPTRRDFEGDITAVIFPILRFVKGNPEVIGKQIGVFLQENVEEVSSFNVVKGFLNIVIDDAFYLNFFRSIKGEADFGFVKTDNASTVMVEYSSPNTNKPLHLGHIRNNLLGYSVSEILKASGKKVYKTQIINDRGIHICKSMLAWERFALLGKDGERETPETTFSKELKKGDKLVGKYYVEYDRKFKEQLRDLYSDFVQKLQKELNSQSEYNLRKAIENIQVDNEYFPALGAGIKGFYEFNIGNTQVEFDSSLENDLDYLLNDNIGNELLEKSRKKFLAIFSMLYGDIESDEIFSEKEIGKVKGLLDEKFTPHIQILKEAQEMLLKWEAGDDKVVTLWKTMNGWVYKGFEETYKNLGVDFDQLYYESDTYLLGKDVVADGIEEGVFFKKEDGSVWIDLTEDGLDEKIVLRSDGTAVYMTQDIGTAIQRVKDYPNVNGMVYTVGNEQDYHFKVLFLILKKLGFSWSEHLYHLSYGMVDLPSGKMKSREGTVVDADDLMEEMAQTAADISQELGKLEDYSEKEKQRLYKMIGLGALKYYILKVDPKKRILFDPEESVDFQGNTGPFIQYTYARIQSILRKANLSVKRSDFEDLTTLLPKEKELIKQIRLFPETIRLAADNYSPALIANYVYDLVKEFNSFYQNVSILGEVDEQKKVLRIQLSKKVGEIVQSAFKLLGIEVPERM
ncbi:MAG: arginine--tRNA ligase [Flavobacteriaceae bacterium]